MKRFHLLLATCFGAGYFPFASGTLASALALLPYWGLRGNRLLYLLVTLGICALGVWTSGRAEIILNEKDSHKIVIDEIAGYLIAAALLPLHWFYPLAAFVLFRVFDVWKPFPAYEAQALPGGWGVMADDVIAAVYANVLLQAARLVLPF
jgi:phosphatidylglycerophosphatase A